MKTVLSLVAADELQDQDLTLLSLRLRHSLLAVGRK